MERPELYFAQGPAPAEAKKLCAACPAYDWCLAWSTANDEAGVWAGQTRGERRRKSKLTRTDVVLVA